MPISHEAKTCDPGGAMAPANDFYTPRGDRALIAWVVIAAAFFALMLGVVSGWGMR